MNCRHFWRLCRVYIFIYLYVSVHSKGFNSHHSFGTNRMKKKQFSQQCVRESVFVYRNDKKLAKFMA